MLSGFTIGTDGQNVMHGLDNYTEMQVEGLRALAMFDASKLPGSYTQELKEVKEVFELYSKMHIVDTMDKEVKDLTALRLAKDYNNEDYQYVPLDTPQEVMDVYKNGGVKVLYSDTLSNVEHRPLRLIVNFLERSFMSAIAQRPFVNHYVDVNHLDLVSYPNQVITIGQLTVKDRIRSNKFNGTGESVQDLLTNYPDLVYLVDRDYYNQIPVGQSDLEATLFNNGLGFTHLAGVPTMHLAVNAFYYHNARINMLASMCIGDELNIIMFTVDSVKRCTPVLKYTNREKKIKTCGVILKDGEWLNIDADVNSVSNDKHIFEFASGTRYSHQIFKKISSGTFKLSLRGNEIQFAYESTRTIDLGDGVFIQQVSIVRVENQVVVRYVDENEIKTMHHELLIEAKTKIIKDRLARYVKESMPAAAVVNICECMREEFNMFTTTQIVRIYGECLEGNIMAMSEHKSKYGTWSERLTHFITTHGKTYLSHYINVKCFSIKLMTCKNYNHLFVVLAMFFLLFFLRSDFYLLGLYCHFSYCCICRL